MPRTTNPKVRAWIDIAKRRLPSILGRHTIANSRTLESKISNAGPYHLRVEPAPLTTARQELEAEGRILPIIKNGTPWFHLDDSPLDKVQRRLEEQLPVYEEVNRGEIHKLIGQALEIAVYRSLDAQTNLEFYGGFPDLDIHDDSTLYSKEEHPSLVSGLAMPRDKKLDFLLYDRDAGHVGVEVKNVRQWLYPDRSEVRELLLKCCAIDAVPVLIARRIPYVTFTELFRPCGVLIHEVYNQRFPRSHEALAEKVKHKMLLGYHDVRIGNEPDARLNHFLHDTLPGLLSDARDKFNDHRDLLEAFGNGSLDYKELHVELYTKWGRYGGEPEEDDSEFYEPLDFEPPDYGPPDFEPGDDDY